MDYCVRWESYDDKITDVESYVKSQKTFSKRKSVFKDLLRKSGFLEANIFYSFFVAVSARRRDIFSVFVRVCLHF